MELLKVENLSSGYGHKVIIKDINFSTKKSEFTALLGLNGTGKTTLLKTISGLIKPMTGKCSINGVDIASLKEKERAQTISYMSQRHSIVYDIKVVDVVVMGITPYLGIFQTPSHVHKERAYEMISLMGMEDYKEHNFNNLSEGQKQLIIIARNLMQNADLLLFDEPDSALDFVNKHMVLSKIRKVVKGENRGGLITLHDPNYALNYCDRIILIHEGTVFADFYTSEIDIEFLEEIFTSIYGEIQVIKHHKKYLIMRSDYEARI
jgi:iron complex transport system ATP-binding protein